MSPPPLKRSSAGGTFPRVRALPGPASAVLVRLPPGRAPQGRTGEQGEALGGQGVPNPAKRRETRRFAPRTGTGAVICACEHPPERAPPMPAARHFPPPWCVDETSVYFEDEPGGDSPPPTCDLASSCCSACSLFTFLRKSSKSRRPFGPTRSSSLSIISSGVIVRRKPVSSVVVSQRTIFDIATMIAANIAKLPKPLSEP
jgi:hypothetical protein